MARIREIIIDDSLWQEANCPGRSAENIKTARRQAACLVQALCDRGELRFRFAENASGELDGDLTVTLSINDDEFEITITPLGKKTPESNTRISRAKLQDWAKRMILAQADVQWADCTDFVFPTDNNAILTGPFGHIMGIAAVALPWLAPGPVPQRADRPISGKAPRAVPAAG